MKKQKLTRSRKSSRSRQAPPNNPILLPLLRLVPVSNQPPCLRDRTIRCAQETASSCTKSHEGGQVCRTFQGCRRSVRFQRHGSGAQVLRRGSTVGLCRISVIG